MPCGQGGADREVPGVHPFRGDDEGAEVNFHNGLQIVYEYAQKVRAAIAVNAAAGFKPDRDLLEYTTKEKDGGGLKYLRTFLTRVTYPTRDGPEHVTLEEVDTHWGELTLEEALDRERCKKHNGKDKEKRRFLHVVAVQMRLRGHLTPQNRPSALALHGAQGPPAVATAAAGEGGTRAARDSATSEVPTPNMTHEDATGSQLASQVAAVFRSAPGELFLGVPRSEWRRMDALEYFSWSKQCWLPALLRRFDHGALLHLNVKREVSVPSASLRPLSSGRYRRTAYNIVRIEGAEPTEDVIINGSVVIRPQCGFR
jgi:hypothetical protein